MALVKFGRFRFCAFIQKSFVRGDDKLYFFQHFRKRKRSNMKLTAVLLASIAHAGVNRAERPSSKLDKVPVMCVL